MTQAIKLHSHNLPTQERAAAARRRAAERPAAGIEARVQRLKSTFQPATLPRRYRSKDHPLHTVCEGATS